MDRAKDSLNARMNWMSTSQRMREASGWLKKSDSEGHTTILARPTRSHPESWSELWVFRNSGIAPLSPGDNEMTNPTHDKDFECVSFDVMEWPMRQLMTLWRWELLRQCVSPHLTVPKKVAIFACIHKLEKNVSTKFHRLARIAGTATKHVDKLAMEQTAKLWNSNQEWKSASWRSLTKLKKK